MKAAEKQGRYDSIDRLRGIAAIAVLLSHYLHWFSYQYGGNLRFPIFNLGEDGVRLFFIISGFVISLSIDRVSSAKDFIFFRLCRLYPTYWICATITFLSVWLLGPALVKASFFEYLVNLTMIPSYFNVPFVDRVYWTLHFEMSFYFWAVVASFVFRRKWWAIPVILFLLNFIVPTFMLIIFNAIDWAAPTFLSYAFLYFYCNYFLAGVLVYHIVTGDAKRRTICGASLVALIAYCAYDYVGVAQDLLIFLSLIFLAVKFPLKGERVLLFLGLISYPLYLVHQNFGYGLMMLFYKWFGNYWVGVFIATALSILISWLIHDYIEVRLQKKLRNWWKMRKAKTVTIGSLDVEATS